MSSFLDIRYSSQKNYDKLSEIFDVTVSEILSGHDEMISKSYVEELMGVIEINYK